VQNGELVEKHFRLIKAVAASVAARDLREDATGAALLRVVASAHRIDPENQPRAFIVAQAIGGARDYMRKQGCHGTVGSKRGTVVEHAAFTGQEPAPGNLLEAMALEKCGLAMLGMLSDRLRRVVLLRYWHDLTIREVAAEMSLSIPRIHQLLTKAHRIIKTELEARGVHGMADVA